MRLRSIIIDDEETGIEALRLLIETYVADLKVVAETTRPADAIELIENYKPEIVFLDISMPDMDGFELLEQLSWKNFSLVFTTAYQEYALKALKKQAIDYLLKPIDYADLCAAVERIKQQLAAQEQLLNRHEYAHLNNINQYYTNKLAVNSKLGVEYIDLPDIVCLESKSNYTLVHLSQGKPILTPKALGHFEGQLCNNSNFMRVHNSFIVNLHKVARCIKEQELIVMLNQQKIPLSKSRRTRFYQWLVG